MSNDQTIGKNDSRSILTQLEGYYNRVRPGSLLYLPNAEWLTSEGNFFNFSYKRLDSTKPTVAKASTTVQADSLTVADTIAFLIPYITLEKQVIKK